MTTDPMPTVDTANAATTNAPTENGAETAPAQPARQEYVHRSLQTSLRTLGETSTKPEAYYRQAFALAVQQYSPLSAMLHLRVGANTISDDYEDQLADPVLRLETQQLYLNEMLADVQGEADSVVRIEALADSSSTVTLISIPIIGATDSHAQGTAVMTFCNKSDDELRSLTSELNSAFAYAVAYEPRRSVPQAKPDRINPELTAIARASNYGSCLELSYTLVNSLCRRYGCSQVSVGVVTRNRVDVIAVSGMASIKQNSPGIVNLRQAMEECLDHSDTICAQETETDSDREFAIHGNWMREAKAAVYSIPLKSDGETTAVISFCRPERSVFTKADQKELNNAVSPFGSAIHLMRRSDRTLTQHISDSCFAVARTATSSTTRSGLAFRIAAALGVLWFCFGSIPYRPTVPCVIAPAQLTNMRCLFDMQLKSVDVDAGDQVMAGQLLAQFDTRDLELALNQLFAEKAQAELEVRHAISQGDMATAALAKANIGVIITKMESVEDKIQACVLRAPQNGMVVEADLKKKIGQLFPQGAPILTFSPMDEWEISLHLPEHVARHITDEQIGSLQLEVKPDESIEYEITRIAGSASVTNGTNTFLATAKITDEKPWLRQGLKGIARTNTGYRKVWWVVLHRFIEAAHMNFWL